MTYSDCTVLEGLGLEFVGLQMAAHVLVFVRAFIWRIELCG